MEYILIDRNKEMAEAWQKYFSNEENVEIHTGDLTKVECDAIVSPANSFGFMDGGVDEAISERLGWHLQDELQRRIKELPEGELLVGKSLVLETGDSLIPFLISSPTMRIPTNFNISTSINAYLAMKATIIAAKAHSRISKIALTGFCTGVGRMKRDISANQMFIAYREIEKDDKMEFEDFGDAQKYHWNINQEGMIWD